MATARKKEQGVPGVRQNFGYINDEWDKRLRSVRNRRDTIQQMLDDATITASLKAIDALARSTEDNLKPADGAPPEVHELVSEEFEAMEGAWGDKLSEILSFIPYGFSLFEIVHRLRPDGRIGWAKWAPRGQETIDRWDYDEDGRDWIACYQVNPNNSRTYRLERDWLLHFVTVSRTQSPEGKSLIRAAFDAWYMTKHIQRIEGIGIERDLSGVPMIKIPVEAWDKDALRNDWIAVLKSLRVNEEAGILLPSTVDQNGNAEYDFSLVSTSGTRSIDTDKIVDRYKREMMRSLLADWLMLGDEGGGSYALGVSKSDAFASFVQSILDSIADAINQQAIKRLVIANGWPEEYAPTLEFERIRKKDIAIFATALTQLAGADMIDPRAEEIGVFAYELLGIPIPEGGITPVEKPEPPQIVQGAIAQNGAPMEDDTEDRNDQRFTEPLTYDLLARGAETLRKMLPPELGGLADAEVVA